MASYIEASITGPDRELLSAFYAARDAHYDRGGTTDQCHLHALQAMIQHLTGAADGSIVPVPRNADQAAAMAMLGQAWLREHAPDRLRPDPQLALPADYIDDNITGPDRELLTVFYTATNSEGGTADEIHLRGIRAVLAQAASGFVVPTAVQVASPAPAEEALQRLLQWGGYPGSTGYSADVVLGVADWVKSGMAGPLPPLPKPLRLRKAAAPAKPTPVDLAALHDPTFSDGLTARQHRDILRGRPNPRPPADVPALANSKVQP